MTSPLLSVVVIGRNEGARLARCLQSVSAMEHPDFSYETLYADSGSSDGSVPLAASLGAKVVALQSSRPTAAQGRNAGWRAARGSIVLFLDGDTILHPRFVAESLAAFDEPSIAVVWGHRRETLETKSFYNRVLDLDWIYPPGFTEFCGGDALFRRATLEAVGGYDDTLIAGEEPELCRRIAALGQRILHADRPMTGHDLGITRWNAYWRRATRAGHAFAEVSARFRQSAHPFWLAESRRNTIRAMVLLTLPALSLLLSIVLRNWLPFAVMIFCLAALAARTAWKARWKSNDVFVLALYGIHSHLQQIPIFAGQVRFWINQRRGRRAALVEYKHP
jgi:glycosyltransferase involved in cell wall biosynthesis